jgi:hypothetical protein
MRSLVGFPFPPFSGRATRLASAVVVMMILSSYTSCFCVSIVRWISPVTTVVKLLVARFPRFFRFFGDLRMTIFRVKAGLRTGRFWCGNDEKGKVNGC